MPIKSHLKEVMRKKIPHTHNSLTHLILALEKVTKNTGKKTLFGRDKGVAAYDNLILSIGKTITAMTLDGEITPSTTSPDVVDAIVHAIKRFSLAYPNWQDAYQFADYIFVEKRSDAIAIIDRTR